MTTCLRAFALLYASCCVCTYQGAYSCGNWDREDDSFAFGLTASLKSGKKSETLPFGGETPYNIIVLNKITWSCDMPLWATNTTSDSAAVPLLSMLIIMFTHVMKLSNAVLGSVVIML